MIEELLLSPELKEQNDSSSENHIKDDSTIKVTDDISDIQDIHRLENETTPKEEDLVNIETETNKEVIEELLLSSECIKFILVQLGQ